MEKIRRRDVLAGAAVAAGVAGLPAPALAAPPAGSPSGAPATAVHPGDARYPEMVVGYNQRWVGSPEVIKVVTSTEQVRLTVQDAVRAGKRLAVRSGGHCYCDFVANAETQVLIDLSAMNQITWDPARKAFCIETGALLGDINQTLYRSWGVALPAGICLTVGIGGHTAGGGFGMLSRKYGLVADHLEAVETVVVGADRKVRTVIASRDPGDPDADLLWATAGGGGGSFGVNTRYWFRSPTATGSDPGKQLPAPPASVLVTVAQIPWSSVGQATFIRLFRNYGAWHDANSAPGAAGTDLCAVLFGSVGGGIGLLTHADASTPGASDLVASYHAALTAGTGLQVAFKTRTVPWLASTKVEGAGTLLYDPTLRSALKTAWLRTSLTDDQYASIYRNLTRTDYTNPNGIFQLVSVGGQINGLPRDATASVHRDSTMFGEFETFWSSAADDEVNVAWLRDLYGQTFAGTGGYPVRNDRVDGCYINNPDMDITDPAYNKSGVGWPELYFGENYPRLQRVKARWDPTDFFRHRQSVRLP
jgi:hypothetical protein